MLLSSIASSKRSFSGKKVLTSNTPSLWKGGVCVCRISSPRSRSWPWLQAFSKMLDSRMCSRERTGSISLSPTSPSRAVTVPEIFSRSSLAVALPGESGRFERGQDADRDAGVRAGGIDGKVSGVLQGRQPLGLDAPIGQALLPALGGLCGGLLEAFARRAAPGRG